MEILALYKTSKPIPLSIAKEERELVLAMQPIVDRIRRELMMEMAKENNMKMMIAGAST